MGKPAQVFEAPKKLFKESKRVVENVVDDPVDQLVDAAIGATAGAIGGPLGGLALQKADQAKTALETVPSIPGALDIASAVQALGSEVVKPPSAQNVGEAFAADAGLQEEVRGKRRRSRASNILTSARGLAPISEANLARKTLLAS